MQATNLSPRVSRQRVCLSSEAWAGSPSVVQALGSANPQLQQGNVCRLPVGAAPVSGFPSYGVSGEACKIIDACVSWDATHNVQMHMAVPCEILRSSSFSPCPAGAVDHCQSALFLLWIMALPTGDPELHALALNCKVPEEYLSYLDGMNVELFSCIATTRDGIDKALEDLLADSPLPGAGPERVRLMASFRLLWERCSAHCSGYGSQVLHMERAVPSEIIRRGHHTTQTCFRILLPGGSRGQRLDAWGPHDGIGYEVVPTR